MEQLIREIRICDVLGINRPDHPLVNLINKVLFLGTTALKQGNDRKFYTYLGVEYFFVEADEIYVYYNYDITCELQKLSVSFDDFDSLIQYIFSKHLNKTLRIKIWTYC